MASRKKQLVDTIQWYEEKIKDLKHKLKDMQKKLKLLKRGH